MASLDQKLDLLTMTPQGLYCPAGDFHIDPRRIVERAVITHAHSDHARSGCGHYLTSESGRALLALRVQRDAVIETLAFGQRQRIGSVMLSLHPAGHLLGSAQVRIEHAGRVCVVTGDFKIETDRSCETFEPLTCDTLITEATFALPIYRWPPVESVMASVHHWWREQQAAGRSCLMLAYALGKAQRVIAALDPKVGPILVHREAMRFVELYRQAGIALPPVVVAERAQLQAHEGRAMIVAPSSARQALVSAHRGPIATAAASGWMSLPRRRQGVDRGFVISDHADWTGLLQAVCASGAQRVGVTHGRGDALVAHLQAQGLDAFVLSTPSAGRRKKAVKRSAPLFEPPDEHHDPQQSLF